MRIKIILLTFACCLIYKAKAQTADYLSYPTFNEVKKKFLREYTLSGDFKIDFAKNKDGIYVVEYSTTTYDSLSRRLYWSREKKSYNQLSYGSRILNNKSSDDYLLTRGGNDHFNENLYYGYNGWFDDLISELGGKIINEERVIYGLSRAYSAKAYGYLGHNYNGLNTDIDPLNLSQENIDNGLECAFKSIKLLHDVYKKNPLFETLVGNIYDKYSNEHMSFFYLLEMNGLTQYSRQFLKDSLYTSTYYDLAKNYLNSCSDNSILITGGDNDTYPLLYLQEKENLKKSVKVVNISLCNSKYYIPYLLKDTRLHTSINKYLYTSKVSDIFYFSDEERKKIDQVTFENFTQGINNRGDGRCIAKTSFSEDENYLVINCRNIKSGLYDISFANKYYLDRSALTILDLIITNADSLNTYFANTVSAEDYSMYKKYLHDEGFVFKISKTENPGDEILYSLADAKKFINTQFVFRKDKRKIDQKEEGILRAIALYRNVFSKLCSEMILKNDKQNALLTVKKAFNYFPLTIYSSDYYTPALIEIYFETGEINTAVSLSNSTYQKIVDYFESNGSYNLKTFPEDVHVNLATLELLQNAAMKGGQSSLKQKYYDTLIKYYAVYYNN